MKGVSHTLDSAAHLLNVISPHCSQLFISPYCLNDVASESRTIGVLRPHKTSQVVIEEGNHFRIQGWNRQTPCSSVVQPEVLGERLHHCHVESLFEEQSDWISVLVWVSRDEALVGHVKDVEEVLLFANLKDFAPLFFAWIVTCRIVSNGMENHSGLLWQLSQGIQKLFVLESSFALIKVLVVLHSESLLLNHLSVQWPRGIWCVNSVVVFLKRFVEVFQSLKQQHETSSSRKRLDFRDAAEVSCFSVTNLKSGS